VGGIVVAFDLALFHDGSLHHSDYPYSQGKFLNCVILLHDRDTNKKV
jgi:hypothetical protein